MSAASRCCYRQPTMMRRRRRSTDLLASCCNVARWVSKSNTNDNDNDNDHTTVRMAVVTTTMITTSRRYLWRHSDDVPPRRRSQPAAGFWWCTSTTPLYQNPHPREEIYTLGGNNNNNDDDDQTILVSKNQRPIKWIPTSGCNHTMDRHHGSSSSISLSNHQRFVVGRLLEHNAVAMLLLSNHNRSSDYCSNNNNDGHDGSNRRRQTQQRRGVHNTTRTTTIHNHDDDNDHHHQQKPLSGPIQQQIQQPQPKFVARVYSSKNQNLRSKKIVKYGEKKEWTKLLDIFQKERRNFGIQNLSVTLSGLADNPTFERDHFLLPVILRATADYIENTASEIDARTYSYICQSIGKLQEKEDESAIRIINYLASTTFVKTFLEYTKNPQDISDIAWSLARLDRPDLMETLLSVMNKDNNKSLNSLLTGTPRVPADMIWACAQLNLQNAARPLLKVIENRAVWLVFHGKPREIEKTAWAFATLQYQSPVLFEAMERRSVWLAVNGDPQNVANTAWAFAKLNYPSPTFFAAIDNCAERLVTKGDPRDIDNIVWAFATLNHQAPLLLAARKKRARALACHDRSRMTGSVHQVDES